MNKEKIKHHLAKLQQNHAELDRKIKEGYSHYIDDEHLQKMKFFRELTLYFKLRIFPLLISSKTFPFR